MGIKVYQHGSPSKLVPSGEAFALPHSFFYIESCTENTSKTRFQKQKLLAECLHTISPHESLELAVIALGKPGPRILAFFLWLGKLPYGRDKMKLELASNAFVLLLMHFPKVSEMLNRNEKKDKIKALIESLSCQDCEEAKRGLCDCGLVGLEVWDCMVERVLAGTTPKGNFPGGSDRTIH